MPSCKKITSQIVFDIPANLCSARYKMALIRAHTSTKAQQIFYLNLSANCSNW